MHLEVDVALDTVPRARLFVELELTAAEEKGNRSPTKQLIR